MYLFSFQVIFFRCLTLLALGVHLGLFMLSSVKCYSYLLLLLLLAWDISFFLFILIYYYILCFCILNFCDSLFWLEIDATKVTSKLCTGNPEIESSPSITRFCTCGSPNTLHLPISAVGGITPGNHFDYASAAYHGGR